MPTAHWLILLSQKIEPALVVKKGGMLIPKMSRQNQVVGISIGITSVSNNVWIIKL